MNGQEVVALVPLPERIARRKRTPNKAHIRHWPKRERPREKLLERGAHALSDAELLAVLLRCGTKGRNAIELAQSHILAFGSLRELLMAEWQRWNPRKKRKPGEKRGGGGGG